MTLRGPIFALWFAVGATGPAAAQDAPAPSLEVATDPDVPHYRLGVTADPVGVFFGAYGVRIEGALGDAHSLSVEPAYLHGDEVDALGLEVGYRLWPLGAGIDGVFAGVAGGLAVTSDEALTTAGSLEVGYQYVWDGIVIGAGVGVTVARTDGQDRWQTLPRVTVALGYAWM